MENDFRWFTFYIGSNCNSGHRSQHGVVPLQWCKMRFRVSLNGCWVTHYRGVGRPSKGVTDRGGGTPFWVRTLTASANKHTYRTPDCACFPTGLDTQPTCGRSRCWVKLITQLNYWLWASVRGLGLTFSKCQPGAELLGLLCISLWGCVCGGGYWEMETSSKWCYRLHWKCQFKSEIILFVYPT